MSLAATNYLIINLSCLLCAAILYFHTGNDLAGSLEIHLFKLLLIIFGLYLIDDSLWELAASSLLPIPYQVRSVLNAIGISCQPVICYVWFLFAEVRLKRGNLRSRWFFPVTSAPMFFSVILILSSPRTGLIFYSNRTDLCCLRLC